MKSVLQYEEPDFPSSGGSKTLHGSPSEGIYDIVCVGFGPAALSIAIALRERGETAKVLFLERQRRFGWHCGMLFPGARMQISFINNLATLRNPRSHFTFLNYLHHHSRLVMFTNLSTTLPLREEFNDYMCWCASHFDDRVQYGQEVLSVQSASPESMGKHPIRKFKVHTSDVETHEIRTVEAKHVVMATGGEPAIPFSYPSSLLHSKIFHSSHYMYLTPRLLPDPDHPYNIAVIGGGQSAAEIFNGFSSKYPRASISLITRASSLKPSDDSPFVNEIFDHSQVDGFFSLPTPTRRAIIQENRLTNYGVVRIDLLEHLYSRMYSQRIHEPDESQWRLNFVFNKEVVAVNVKETSSARDTNIRAGPVQLQLRDVRSGEELVSPESFDLVLVATGYSRHGHERMLQPLNGLFADGENGDRPKSERDYRVRFREGAVSKDARIWLQGCCEESHG